MTKSGTYASLTLSSVHSTLATLSSLLFLKASIHAVPSVLNVLPQILTRLLLLLPSGLGSRVIVSKRPNLNTLSKILSTHDSFYLSSLLYFFFLYYILYIYLFVLSIFCSRLNEGRNFCLACSLSNPQCFN